ncbi:hypothetical protein [Methylopila sp. M107]|uniref:hypothetical protein n=1 Tax=Methylopila sp. M107 TaxID=1101190 RepID=UPI00039A7DC4|nr:hypothetical protein [Methylopila sp. M107]
MAQYQMPFSGDVSQASKIFTSAFSAVGSQFGFINIHTSRSSAPEVEEQVLQEVGSYGKQIGQISDVLALLLAKLPPDTVFSPDEKKAIARFEVTLDAVNAIKLQNKREPLRIG